MSLVIEGFLLGLGISVGFVTTWAIITFAMETYTKIKNRKRDHELRKVMKRNE